MPKSSSNAVLPPKTFGGTTPLQFDDRYFALRTGLANSVTNPTPEIADTLTAFRFGADQRWQTRARPGRSPADYRLDHARYQRRVLSESLSR